MTDRIDIHEPLYDICRRIGLDPTFVKELTIEPMAITATIYEPDANGNKHIAGPNESPVLSTRIFEVQT